MLETQFSESSYGVVNLMYKYRLHHTCAWHSDVSYSGISLGWGWTRTVNCMRNNRVHANLIHHYAKHMYDVAGIYTLGSQPHSWITENCVS